MATIQFFAFPDNSTVANTKLWAQGISSALASFGWVQASDTGQVNWSTFTTPFASSQSVFEVWQMGDALQATNPVFMRINYGNTNSGNGPTLAIIVGSGSNGAGTLTNATPTYQLAETSGQNNGLVVECDLSGASNRLHFCMWRSLATISSFFSIERSHNASGADTASYVTVLTGGPQIFNLAQQTLLPAASGGLLFQEKFGLTFQSNNTSAAFATSTATVPFFPLVGKLDNPLLGALCLKAGDFADGSVFTASMYGSNHTYMALKVMPANVGSNTAGVGNIVGMRFE